ncbi:MAG: GNAT family N-acetyltransferase [Thiomargarita sp.]|nr:GNAT family N-acetyltransferase [Thiomargarita sp.]
MVLTNQGHLIRLRQTVPDDAPIILRAYQDENFISLFRSNNAQQTEEQLRKILADRLENEPTKLGHVEFMIEHKKQGPIGIALLGDYTPVHQRAEYLIGLFDESHRSIGYGTEATLLVLELAFNFYKLHKIYTYVYDYNELSEKSTIKFGFKQEGLLEDHHYLLGEKRFVSLYINGMTEARFRECEQIRRYSLRLLGRDVTLAPQVIKVSEDSQIPVEQGKKFLEAIRAGRVDFSGE